jgi:hypothetical protein
MATIMAMIAPMKIVPQNKGIEPNAPDEPTWSARIAVCGLQCSAEQEFAGRHHLKKRRLSNISDSTIPSVVRIAISDAARSSAIIHRSTLGPGAETRAESAQREGAESGANDRASAPPIDA